MSKKYGIYCENCNILLNNEDDIFGTNLGQLYHSNCMHMNHGKSAECQLLMLFRMNLQFADTPTPTTTAEGEIMELKNSNNKTKIRQSVQKLKAKIKTLEDALLVKDRLKDDVNKLMDCVVKLANTLSIDVVNKAFDIVNNTSQDENNLNDDDSSLTGEVKKQNIEHNNSNNGVLQSVQQLEARIKTLEDALLQTKSDGNKLTDCVETVEKNKPVDTAADGGNNITQEPNANKQKHNENNLSGGEQHNDTENVASARDENYTCTASEEKQEVVDLRSNCVLIMNPNHYSLSLDEKFSYVRKLANEMNARIADNSVFHIDTYNSHYYVYFRDAKSKFEFLRNRFIYQYNPNTDNSLRILDYSHYGIVNIKNFKSSDLSLATAFVNVSALAHKMGMINIINFIDNIDAYSTKSNFLTYSVTFNSEDIKNVFLQNKDILKEFPETKSLEISDLRGHTSSYWNVNNISMVAASANVIGIGEQMGLSLSIDNFKRIYVLDTKESDLTDDHYRISLVVEFSSNDIKNIFLQKKSELERIGNIWSSLVFKISDIKTKGNMVSIEYTKGPYNVYTAISFIGLAKQLGFPFTLYQTERFIQLSEFIWKTSF
ncbi:hypothetical protein DOY81_007736 [Sarcophaga bullata]|nr:hypothetical protein DOY81_007736 [Sarcophaga bullata]